LVPIRREQGPQEGGRSGGKFSPHAWSLVIAEVALATVALIDAGLFVGSFGTQAMNRF
jgi:hypothetical protein